MNTYRRNRIQLWGAPIALGLVSTVGLIAALLADGVGDVLSWVALAIPVLIVTWYAVR